MVLKAGAAKAVITPPVNNRLAGYRGRTGKSIGILDDLFARALVLDNGENSTALAVCDLIGVWKDMVSEVRKNVSESTNIPFENVTVTAIHTHTGPDSHLTGADWMSSVSKIVSGTIIAAWNKLKEARIGLGRGESEVGVNRRNPRSPSGPYQLYSWPEGPMDKEVQVLRVEDKNGNLISAIINYQCHPVAMGPRMLQISRDFVGYALDVIEEVKGSGVIPIFLQGTCGNINPRYIWNEPDAPEPLPSPSWPFEKEDLIVKETERLGNMLGGETLRVLESITSFVSEARIKSARKSTTLPFREDLPEMALKRRRGLYERIMSGEKEIPVEVQALALDDVAIIGIPGEVFLEYGLDIKRKSPYEYTFVSELTNQESVGYVVTPESMKEGGYEPKTAVCAPEAGEELVKTSIALLKELHGQIQ